ncbi:MAG TPA: TlpA disulfide reductase family protein [Acidimicrobiales bacterium]
MPPAESAATTGSKRRRRWLIGAALAAAAVVVVAVVTSGGSADTSPVATARPFSLGPVLSGGPPSSLAGAPGHPVVLTFFASWCQPCTQELPLLERLARSWDGERARSAVPSTVPVVVGVDELDHRPDGPDMVRRAGVTFPAGYDHDGSVGRRWLVDGLPITVFIAPDGRVVAYHRGQLRQPQLDVLVRRLVAAAG